MDEQEKRKRNNESHRKIYALDLEKSRKLGRDKYKMNHETKKERVRGWERQHPESSREKSRRYRLSHPEVEKAHGIASRIPLAEKCEICGAEAKNRHHSDYSLPRVFISVCTECHGKLHRKDYDGR